MPAHKKRLILITFGMQGRQKWKTPWSCPKAHRHKQLITSLNQKLPVSSLWKLKGNQPSLKVPAVHLMHLEEEHAEKDEEVEIKDPDGLDGVTEEFMMHLVRVVKDAQVEEKCCYHCSSLEHFVCNCPLVRALRENMWLNCREGTASKKGAWTPLTKWQHP